MAKYFVDNRNNTRRAGKISTNTNNRVKSAPSRDVQTSVHNEVKRGELYYCKKESGKDEDGNTLYRKSGRPGIIVSSDRFNRCCDSFLVVMLTSQPRNDYSTHVVISDLKKSSKAICEQIVMVSRESLGDKIKDIPKEEMNLIDVALGESLDLHMGAGEAISGDLERELILYRTERDTYKRMYEQLLKRCLG